MKFFTKTGHDAALKKIVGEMINITLGETYFDNNGALLDEKKANHNTYVIDSVEYQIYPNIGLIYIIDSDVTLYNVCKNVLERLFRDALRLLADKFGTRDISSPINVTTQYLTILNTQSALLQNIQFLFGGDPTGDITSKTANFTWRVLLGEMPISKYSYTTSHIYSLSSIVLDNIGAIALPDGFRHSDYPSYKNYVKGNSLHVNALDIHPSYGIHNELLKYFPNVVRPTKSLVFGTITKRPITLVKWEWLKPYSINPESNISWFDQIKMGLLDTEPSEEVSYNCFVTNAPIYEDCYVFDIIERTVEEFIDEKDLDKYPDATVCRVPEKKAPDVTVSNSNAPAKGKTSGVKVVKPPVTRSALKSKTKTAEKSKTKTAEKSNSKTTEKSIIKRGSNSPTNMIKITYSKKYTTPKCILISPYFVHLMDSSNQIDEFEKLADATVLIYRTKSPVTTEEIIQKCSAPDQTKKVLSLLHQSATIKEYNTVTCADKSIIFRYGKQGSVTTDTLKLNAASPEMIVQLESKFE